MTRHYPDRAVVEGGVKLCNELLTQKKDNEALLRKMLALSDDFYDLSEDMADVSAFFKNQRPIYEKAADLLQRMTAEQDYLQAEQSAVAALSQIRSILSMPKPYKRIAELPNLNHTVQTSYAQLLDLKKQEVFSEIQAAMAEIHQTANTDQMGIVTKADDALAAKKNAAAAAETLTQLDAMKIQVANIRQQYLKALVVVVRPQKKTVTVPRSSICGVATLNSSADVDAYVREIREKLLELLDGNDTVCVI